MGTLSPQRKTVMFGTNLAGRLAPMAADNANARLDSLLLSVSAAGLNQRQIDQVPFRPVTEPLRRWASRFLARMPLR